MRGRRVALLVAVVPLLAAGCGTDVVAGTAVSGPTVTATVTVTETVTPEARPEVLADAPPVATSPPVEVPPMLELSVHTDGCGVIRSEAAPGVDYHNLTWSVLDRDGFQVLGRNAQGETRYRYFTPGTFTVVLEAFVGDHYRPVSNEVTITC